MLNCASWSDEELELRFRELYSAKDKCVLPSTEVLVRDHLQAMSREIEFRERRKKAA